MPIEVDAGYFQLHSDFCSMGEGYLLGSGVEFDESIANLKFGSSEGLRTSISDSQMEVSSAGSDATWRSDLFRITEVPNCASEQYNVRSSELSYIPSCHDSQMLVEEKSSLAHRLHVLQSISNFDNSSNCSFQDALPDGNDRRLPPSAQMICSLKTQRNNKYELADQEDKTNMINGNEAVSTLSVKASCMNDLPTEKRSRKPTKRYIDELPDPFSAFSKKKRSSTFKDKSCEVKDKKKCHVGSKELKLPDEEFSVKAIQVPFGSLVHTECPMERSCDMVQHVDSRKIMSMSKCKRVTPENHDGFVTAVPPRIRDDLSTSQKKDACVTATNKKKRNGRITVATQKKSIDCIVDESPKTEDDRAAIVSIKNLDDHLTPKQQRKIECLASESLDEVSGRRKHHRLWTISEVKKLIDGVSQYGVGRWSRIKKLFFSSSAHRTSVDLKDKWRNLLKASGIQKPRNQQGEKKRSMAWRPLPKSILCRVCELATMHPYPKGQRAKMLGSNMIDRDSPDRSADVTLSDYRRILRSINGN